MANVDKKKNQYVDPGWPKGLEPGEHPVTEIVARHAGADSPYGDITFPVPAETLDYVHPTTIINK
ncbi:hypothetical protein [uncultured Corynebacterium sp.]|uniref:hypothetical protein n=1 Tax=uncultured Corynebacterium sp. TaxID=159447 RepID=UPI0025E1B34D|nr:hypothetical protein [uncultured Corynebacterium sp.]